MTVPWTKYFLATALMTGGVAWALQHQGASAPSAAPDVAANEQASVTWSRPVPLQVAAGSSEPSPANLGSHASTANSSSSTLTIPSLPGMNMPSDASQRDEEEPEHRTAVEPITSTTWSNEGEPSELPRLFPDGVQIISDPEQSNDNTVEEPAPHQNRTSNQQQGNATEEEAERSQPAQSTQEAPQEEAKPERPRRRRNRRQNAAEENPATTPENAESTNPESGTPETSEPRSSDHQTDTQPIDRQPADRQQPDEHPTSNPTSTPTDQGTGRTTAPLEQSNPGSHHPTVPIQTVPINQEQTPSVTGNPGEYQPTVPPTDSHYEAARPVVRRLPGATADLQSPQADRSTPASETRTSLRTHIIRDGDTLEKIALRYLGSNDRYLEIYAANTDRLASPNLLPIGVELVIPSPSAALQGNHRYPTTTTEDTLPSRMRPGR